MRIFARPYIVEREMKREASLLLFPIGASLLQLVNALLIHKDAVFIVALVFPMAVSPPIAILIHRKYGIPSGAVAKYGIASLILVALSSLIAFL